MKKTVRQRIARAIDDKHGLRLSPSDVIDLDCLLPPLPKIYHTVSQDPFMVPYGKGLLRQTYEAQNVAKSNWELPPVFIYVEEEKTVFQSFKEKAQKYRKMIDTFLRNYFYRGSN